MQTPSILLMGPTATGKTDLAVWLQQKLPVELISVDSTLVYRDLNIGSGKPSPEILKIAPHHLIDILDPSVPYSAGQFLTDANKLISGIKARGHIPLFVGGTMLYFKALIYGFADLPAQDAAIRLELEIEAQKNGVAALHEKLKQCDPKAAEKIHSNDFKRIQRALEIYFVTGKPISHWFQLQRENKQSLVPSLNTGSFLPIALAPQENERSLLHQRIDERLTNMLANGLIDEVKALFTRGDLSLSLPSIRSVGYQQVWRYLLQEYDYDLMKEKALIATRQLAKHQLTWLRRFTDCQVFDYRSSQLNQDVLSFLQKQLP